MAAWEPRLANFEVIQSWVVGVPRVPLRQAWLKCPETVVHCESMIDFLHGRRYFIVMQPRPLESSPRVIVQLGHAAGSNGVKKSHEFDWSSHGMTDIGSESKHLGRGRMMNAKWALVNVVKLVHQKAVRGVLDNSAVVDHAANGSDNEGTSADAEKPYLGMHAGVPCEILCDKVVDIATLPFRVGGQRTVPNITQEVTAQANPVEISRTNIASRRAIDCRVCVEIDSNHPRKNINVTCRVRLSAAPGPVTQSDDSLCGCHYGDNYGRLLQNEL